MQAYRAEARVRNFDIEIHSRDGEVYPVVARMPDSGDEPYELLPLPVEKLREILTATFGDSAPGPVEQQIDEAGRQLFAALFQGKIRYAFEESRARLAEGERLRIRLNIASDALEVAALPWELLADPERGPLVLSGASIVRYVPQDRHTLRKAAAPLKVLLTRADPGRPLSKSQKSLSPQAIERDLEALQAALRDLAGQIEITVEPQFTLEKLQEHLQKGNFHIWHFRGQLRADEPGLFLEDASGYAEPIGAMELGVLLSHSSVGLMTLDILEIDNAIESLHRLAPALIGAGVPALVGARFTQTGQQAMPVFARELYRALASGLPIDVCVDEGRRAIMEAQGMRHPDWGVPVVYTSVPDGQLFEWVTPAQEGVANSRDDREPARSENRAAGTARRGESAAQYSLPGYEPPALEKTPDAERIHGVQAELEQPVTSEVDQIATEAAPVGGAERAPESQTPTVEAYGAGEPVPEEPVRVSEYTRQAAPPSLGVERNVASTRNVTQEPGEPVSGNENVGQVAPLGAELESVANVAPTGGEDTTAEVLPEQERVASTDGAGAQTTPSSVAIPDSDGRDRLAAMSALDDTTSGVETEARLPQQDDRTDAPGNGDGERAPIAIAPILLPYQPPPPDHQLAVTVTAKTVFLTFGGNTYSSPNRIDRTALLRTASVKEYGEILFQGIINNAASAGAPGGQTTDFGYRTARQQTGRRLRFELWVDPNDLDLHGLKWEYLKDAQEVTPLAAFERSPFVRRLQGPFSEVELAPQPLKILVAISNPTTLGQEDDPVLEKLPPLDFAQERAIVDAGLERLKQAGMVEYTVLGGPQGPPVTPAALLERLQEGYSALHIVAHGVRIQGEYFIVLEADDRRERFISAAEFEALLQDSLRLVVLVACQSALLGVGEALQGLGPRLVRAGAPAVIAMQDLIPIEVARFFTRHFYDDLARSGSVDMAMAATRLSLYQQTGPTSKLWGIPALLMGTGEGLLFDVNREMAEQLDRPESRLAPVSGQAASEAGRARLAHALRAEARAYGASTDLLAALQTLAALPRAAASTEPETLRPRQNLDDLAARLRPQVEIRAGELKQHIAATGLALPDSIYRQVASALNAGKHIIFIGPPGTGKTTLAQEICAYAEQQRFASGVTPTTATADWSTFDTMGGYTPTPEQTLVFRPGIFLRSISAGNWLVIDEINRAEIDKAFGELFTVLAGQRVELPYRVGGRQVRVLPPAAFDPQGGDLRAWIPADTDSDHDYVIHPSWRILAAMNVYDKSYLFAMSFAFMRRFAFVDLDVPARAIYDPLLQRWLARQTLLDAARVPYLLEAPDAPALLRTLRELLAEGNDLMSRRTLGPAILRDMIAYIGDRFTQMPEADQVELLCEACLLYAAPQLDGLDQEGIRAIYLFLERLFPEGEARASVLARIRLLYPHLPRDYWKDNS